MVSYKDNNGSSIGHRLVEGHRVLNDNILWRTIFPFSKRGGALAAMVLKHLSSEPVEVSFDMILLADC